jgi:hypothetical protein
VALVLEFLSEVSFDGKFLTRSVFEAQATPRQVGGTLARVLPVQAMRIGRGTLLRAGSRSVFVSRAPDEELPSALVQGLLESAGEAAPR